MEVFLGRRLDYAVSRYRLDTPMEQRHARWLRGAVSCRAGRREFHQHDGDRLIYHHPLVRYDVSTGDAAIVGLAEGAMLLRSIPAFEAFSLGPQTHRVVGHRVEAYRVDVGPTTEAVSYVFRTPYLALNQENFLNWSARGPSSRTELLGRILIGNVLSFSKAIGMHVGERLHAGVNLEPEGWQELKPGVRLLGFRGSFRINFALPDLWGIGKSSSRGFGTLARSEV